MKRVVALLMLLAGVALAQNPFLGGGGAAAVGPFSPNSNSNYCVVYYYNQNSVCFNGFSFTPGTPNVFAVPGNLAATGALSAGSLGSPFGTAATVNTGTSGHVLPFLDGVNTFGSNQIIVGNSGGPLTLLTLQNSCSGCNYSDAELNFESGVSTYSHAAIHSTPIIGVNQVALTFFTPPANGAITERMRLQLGLSIGSTTDPGAGNLSVAGTLASIGGSSNNTATTWTFGAATGSGNMISIADQASNTGTGALLSINTASGSAASPWKATANAVGFTVGSTGSLTSIGGATITYNVNSPPTNSVVCYKAGGVMGYATNTSGVIGTTCN